MATTTKSTPSVSKPNLAAIQRDIEIALDDLKKQLYDEQLSLDCYARMIREFAEMMDEAKLSSYYTCLFAAQDRVIALTSDIQKHEEYLINLLIEKI